MGKSLLCIVLLVLAVSKLNSGFFFPRFFLYIILLILLLILKIILPHLNLCTIKRNTVLYDKWVFIRKLLSMFFFLYENVIKYSIQIVSAEVVCFLANKTLIIYFYFHILLAKFSNLTFIFSNRRDERCSKTKERQVAILNYLGSDL